MTGDLTEFIKLLIHSACDHITFSELGCCLRMHCPSKVIQKPGTVTHVSDKRVQSLDLSTAEIDDRLSLAESATELHHFPRHDLAGGRTRNDSFKVAYITYHCLQTYQIILIINEMLDHSISIFKLGKVHHRHRQPCPQHTRAHRRRAFVHHLHKRCSLLSGRRSEYLQIAECETVHPYECTFINARYRTNVCKLLMLRLLEIYEQSAGRSDTKRETVDGETLEGIDLELPLELFYRTVIDERPFLEG